MTDTTATTGPVRRAERALVPDLTRGVMLLFIALANAANVAFASQPGVDASPNGLERIVNVVLLAFVDSRAYPVFAVMFGYGLVQLARRQGGDARRVLLRRNTALIGFGLVHATLLYFGDFLGAYGIIGIIVTLLLLPRRPRFHRVVLWLWALQTAYVAGLAVLAGVGATGGSARLDNHANPSLDAGTYVGSMLDRLQEWPVHTATVVPMVVIVWLGVWAAQHRVLEEPARHVRMLVAAAASGLAIAVLGGLPYALVGAGVLDVDQATVDAFARLHAVSGEYGGPGYVALFALLALRVDRSARPVAAVAALWQRSLSGYLFQSIAWMAVFAPWSVGVWRGDTIPAFLVAIAVWLVSVAGAAALDRRANRGPAETVLRRVAYDVR